MAKEKQMNSRIQMKHDTEANWIIAGNATKPFIPKQGEIIIYDIDSTYNYERMKIGDGLTGINNLPFIAEANGSAYDAAENGGLIKNENNEFAIDDTITFFFVGGTAADIANIPATERLEGDGQEFYTTAPSTLSFRSTAPLNELQDVQINGETVNPANYELEEGSTIVKLKHDYLSTLRDGQYELSVVSNSKTAKGDFTVASPQLNEYGFYYNQPYYISNVIINDGGMNTVSLNGAFLMAANNTVFVLNQEGENVSVNSYTCENNYFTFAFSGATLTGSFTSNGKSFITSKIFIAGGGWVPDYNGTEQIEFKIDSSAIACDTDYWYFKGINDTLVALPIDKTQSSYVLPKTDICGIPVIRFASSAFSYNTNLTLINFIPNSFSSISANMCWDCTRLTSINIPNGITIIKSSAFQGCTSLTTINFEGTMAQWNAIEKAINWNFNVPATHVHCIDGDVEI